MVSFFSNRAAHLLWIILLASHAFAFGQSGTNGQENNPFVQSAVAQIEQSLLPPKGVLYQFAIENQLKGVFTFDITIRKKGEVATVFVISCEETTIKMQNLLKDRLKTLKFDMKIPKGQSYKFRYTFKFPL